MLTRDCSVEGESHVKNVVEGQHGSSGCLVIAARGDDRGV